MIFIFISKQKIGSINFFQLFDCNVIGSLTSIIQGTSELLQNYINEMNVNVALKSYSLLE